MNIKSVKSGFGIGCLVFAAAAVIALPVRILQFFTVIESGTGFYTETDWSVYLLYIVLAAAIIAILALGIAKRKKLDYSLEYTKRPGLSSLSLIAACGILLDAYNCFIRFISEETVTTASGSSLDSSKLIIMLEGVFALLSAIYFIMLWLTYLKGNSNGSGFWLLSLTPVLWSIFRLVVRFMRTISYIRVSELLIEMIMISFMILFFMIFAQVNCGINGKGNEWKIAAYGLPAALTALICFIPRLVVMISGNSHLFYSESGLEFCDFGIALFIIATVLTRITDKLPDENTSEE